VATQLIRFNEPRLWINSGGSGQWVSDSGGCGAQFAHPDKLVFALGRRRLPDVRPELGTIATHAFAHQDRRHE